MNKKGFTLAEMIIAMSIIGAIATLCISTFMSSDTSNNTKYVNGLRKVYTELSMATDQIKANNGGTISDLFDDPDEVVTEYCKYLKCLKTCGKNLTVSSGCFNALSGIKTLDGSQTIATMFDVTDDDHRGVVLADGSFIAFDYVGKSCTSTTDCIFTRIDINGFKGPNIFGRDVFIIYLRSNNLYALDTCSDNICCSMSSVNALNGLGCAAKILKEGNMNY